MSGRNLPATEHWPQTTVFTAIQLSKIKKGAATTGFSMKPV
jgi:hypothetical protein